MTHSPNTTKQETAVTHSPEYKSAIHAWIREDAPLSIKMVLMPTLVDKLVERVHASAKDIERKAYERAAEEILYGVDPYGMDAYDAVDKACDIVRGLATEDKQ